MPSEHMQEVHRKAQSLVTDCAQVDVENVAEVRKVSVQLLLAKNVSHVHICMDTSYLSE